MNKLKTLSSKTVFTHPWESIEIETVLMPNGKQTEYLISKPNPYVITILTNTNGQIALLTQYKHAARRILSGFSAGYIQKGETPLKAAKRELMEELGITAYQWKFLGKFYENPTRSPVLFYVYSAVSQNANFASTNLDELEGDLKVQWVLDSDLKHCLKNKMLSSPMVTAFAVYSLMRSS